MDLGANPFEYPNREYIYHQYNVDLSTMQGEEKLNFIDSENEKLTEKVHALALGLTAVIDKMKNKKESKPAQVFIKKNEEYQDMESNVENTFKKIKQCQHEVTLSRRLLTNSYNISEIENLEAQVRAKESE